MNGDLSKADFKKVRVDEALRRKKIRQFFIIAGMAAVGFLLIFALIWYVRSYTKNLPGKFFSDEGREHVGPDHGHSYNSNPPTSGPHFASPAEWGVYKEELQDEVLIHNLEHGGIWISYKPDISEDIRQKLESFYDKFGRKVIVTPRPKNESDIALAAWNHLDKFNANEYSDERIERFIRAFRNKGPEFVP